MNSQNNKFYFLFLIAGLLVNAAANGQKTAGAIDLVGLAKKNGFTVINRSLTVLPNGGRPGVRLEQQDADAGFAWLANSTFSRGTIEFDARGKDVFQRSFLGIAFHATDEKQYDAIYFRPFNFRAEDPVRHRHAVQYISIPGYDWPTLRKDHPDQYENAINPAPEPNDWFHARIVVDNEIISVFVNDNVNPSLSVKKLNDRKEGKIGLWVGSGSGGDFANLKITPVR
ncbi:family 16 glycoside hydrolase [Larkinella terrae]|uniref:DUF1080 domain-containing protein n=1 Tax=Larkinella terrae TaxID=2025311 RepID=A0A7K0ENI1_9BACT|nr:family 16 glycoside hydrolase [Larkinella terrae]MRS63008.1 DUF1080 domain-containing protein [Larkinella terrae]